MPRFNVSRAELRAILGGDSDDLASFVAKRGAPIILDGGLATSLELRGMPMKPPLWTSEALYSPEWSEVLHDIHRAYVVAGAEIITANSFRAGKSVLRHISDDDAAMTEVVNRAIKIARDAVDSVPGANALIAGSMAPVADCYRPDLIPPPELAWDHHRWQAQKLAAAGADLLLCETFNAVCEALIAVRAAVETGLPVWVSFVGQGGSTLAGDNFQETCRMMAVSGASAILLNCSTLETITAFLKAASANRRLPFGFYPNNEARSQTIASSTTDCCTTQVILHDDDVLARHVAALSQEYGASIIGGCCGTTPDYI